MTQTLHPTIFGAGRPEIYGPSVDLVPLLDGLIPPARPRSLYVHVPFCFHKCHYCDFYSIVDTGDQHGAFVDRLCGELLSLQRFAARPLETIFVGGGTPTLLDVQLWRPLLTALEPLIDPGAGLEFTVEANPETVTAELLETLAAGGVNRLSIGAQSFDPTHLKTLERWHDPQNVARAVALARAAGIGNVNLDLIFAVPGQSVEQWLGDLDAAIALGPEHVSCYALTYEPNTPMTARLGMGQIQRADEDIEAEMFVATRQRLRAAGYGGYEISNFARAGFECRHNLAYWRDEDWLTAGPSASGHVSGLRWKNAPHLGRYLDSSGLAPLVECERARAATRLAERLMMGLRLAEGVDGQVMMRAADAIGRGEALAAAVAACMGRGEIDAGGQGGMIDTRERWVIVEGSLLLADGIIASLMRAVDP